MKNMNEFRLVAIIALCTLLIVTVTPIVRYTAFEGLAQGEIAYQHQRLAGVIWDHGVVKEDPLTGREYHFNLYDLLLALGAIIVGISLSTLLIPALLGIASSVFVYLLLKRLEFNVATRLFTHLILLSSPAFIYLTSTSTQYSLIFLLMTAGLYLLITRGFILGIILTVAITSFGIVESVYFLLVLIAVAIMMPNEKKKVFIAIAVVLLSTLFFPWVYIEPMARGLYLPSFISDFGGTVGLGIFHAVLTALGLIFSWKQKRKLLLLYAIILIVLLGFFMLGNAVLIYLLPFVSYFAAIALVQLSQFRWQVTLVRDITLLVLACGLVFSSLSYFNQMTQLGPTPEIVESLEWLKENSLDQEIVFTTAAKGFLVQYFSNRRTFSDPFSPRSETSSTLFFSRSLKDTTTILIENDIDYVIVDTAMRDGEIWQREDEGLLFLLQSRETFKSIYATSGVEIWRVRKK